MTKPCVLSNFACSFVHLPLITRSVFASFLEFAGQTGVLLHACLNRPSADSTNSISLVLQSIVLVSVRCVPSRGLQVFLCGFMQYSPVDSGVLLLVLEEADEWI